jgi:type I restriction enzyme, S subunit
LEFKIQCKLGNSTGTSAGMKNISQEAIRRLVVALPTIEEQATIAKMLATHDRCLRAETRYRDKLALKKHGLMDDLLTGRVRDEAAKGALV